MVGVFEVIFMRCTVSVACCAICASFSDCERYNIRRNANIIKSVLVPGGHIPRSTHKMRNLPAKARCITQNGSFRRIFFRSARQDHSLPDQGHFTRQHLIAGRESAGVHATGQSTCIKLQAVMTRGSVSINQNSHTPSCHIKYFQ